MWYQHTFPYRLYKTYQYKGIAEILMLHRVLEKRSILQANRILEITPDFLETLIEKYLANGYEFLTLDGLIAKLSLNRERGEKYAVITFDDGYEDNYSLAYPILKKYNIPFTLYLSTSFPDGDALLWWYALEEILTDSNGFRSNDGTDLPCNTIEQKNAVFDLLRNKILNCEIEQYEDHLNRLFKNYNIDFRSKCIDLSLTWDQLKLLSEEPLCTIASHTVNHYYLTGLSREQMQDEITKAEKVIYEKLGIEVKHFAYPFGAWNKEIAAFLNKKGYRSAVTLRNRMVKRSHKRQLHCLSRIKVEQ